MVKGEKHKHRFLWRSFALAIFVAFSFTLIVGCVPPDQPTPTDTEQPTQAPTTIQTETPVESAPIETTPSLPSNRIICLAPSMVEVIYALGAGDEIVGWSRYVDYPPEVTKKEGWIPYEEYEFVSNEEELKREVAVVAEFTTYNAELIDLLEPTLILTEADIQVPMTEALQAKGYEAYNYTPHSIEEVYEMMLEIGTLIGRQEEAEKLIAYYKQEIASIEAITKDLPKVSVYLEIAHQTEWDGTKYGPYATGSGTPFDQMIEIAGGVNVLADFEGDYVEVSFEDIVETNPDVILSPMWPNAYDYEITTIYEIMTRPGFENISAVKTSRVHFYDSSLFKRFGPRTLTAIEKLAYLLHPYHFNNPPDSVSPWELGKIDEQYPPDEPLR